MAKTSKPKSVPPQKVEDAFEKKSLEELVCHQLSHISIDMEGNGEYTADVVCSCGKRLSFYRSAWERVCRAIEAAAEDEKRAGDGRERA